MTSPAHGRRVWRVVGTATSKRARLLVFVLMFHTDGLDESRTVSHSIQPALVHVSQRRSRPRLGDDTQPTHQDSCTWMVSLGMTPQPCNDQLMFIGLPRTTK